jgi:hypothetical protein
MSRSYKKPWTTDYSKAKSFFKGFANRRIRRMPVDEGISNGKSYKRYYCSYDICDYKFQYNPNPYVRFDYRKGKLVWQEPEPIYKYNRK